MAHFELEDSIRNHPTMRLMEQQRADRGDYDQIRAELDAYYVRMKQYPELEPDQVMLDLSGLGARLTEIRAQLVRDNSQRANALRTKEVDPLLGQIDLQFKLHSRIATIRQFEWDIAKGQA